nr:hypothetical protein [Endozoicomonas sp.]
MLSLFISTSLVAGETWDIGGMFTRVYHDGRPADWGEYALQAARMAVRDVNDSGMLGG